MLAKRLEGAVRGWTRSFLGANNDGADADDRGRARSVSVESPMGGRSRRGSSVASAETPTEPDTPGLDSDGAKARPRTTTAHFINAHFLVRETAKGHFVVSRRVSDVVGFFFDCG